MSLPTIGVLISGRGSNLQALIDATKSGVLRAKIGLVLANKADAKGLERARLAGIEARWLDPRQFTSRDAYDFTLATELQGKYVSLVCLAGYMRLLSPVFLGAFRNAVLNIHPSLLPAFPGLDAQRQALEHGVRVSGATVHFVTPGLDDGPIVAQAAVAVEADDTEATLSARILAAEHALYPAAVQRVLDGGWRIDGRRVRWESPR
ncbi:MAG: phosphoribosylglycinamide formyltransferase [Vicinamibacterales bacterium]